MKNVRQVFEKLREAKYHHLVDLYKQYLKKVPNNCLYNKPYKVSDELTMRLCLLHQPEDLSSNVYPHLVEVCQEPKHCSNCNAFILKYSKEDIKNIFNEELKNKKIREEKYPDICALEWTLEKDIQPEGNLPWYKKLYYLIKRRVFKL